MFWLVPWLQGSSFPSFVLPDCDHLAGRDEQLYGGQ